jgi:DnaJ-class molecular chaperone
MNDEQTTTDLPDLERECGSCNGKGWFEHPHAAGHMTRVTCGVCDGDGVINTEFGDRVIKFVEKNFRRMLRRNI